jgi:hypothetical protein
MPFREGCFALLESVSPRFPRSALESPPANGLALEANSL